MPATRVPYLMRFMTKRRGQSQDEFFPGEELRNRAEGLGVRHAGSDPFHRSPRWFFVLATDVRVASRVASRRFEPSTRQTERFQSHKWDL